METVVIDSTVESTPSTSTFTKSIEQKSKSKKIQVLFELYGLEQPEKRNRSSTKSKKNIETIKEIQGNEGIAYEVSSKSSDSIEEGCLKEIKSVENESQKVEEGDDDEEGCEDEAEDETDELEIDSKNMFQIVLFNYRLTVKDSTPATIPGFDFLTIGSLGSAYNFESLKQHGITHILCLSGVIKLMFPGDFIYKRVVLNDKAKFDLRPYLEECYSFINEARDYQIEAERENEEDIEKEEEITRLNRDLDVNQSIRRKDGKILVHCYQGISRATTICAAYLIEQAGYTRSMALETIRSVRSKALPNSGFLTILKDLEDNSPHRKEILSHYLGNTTSCYDSEEDIIVASSSSISSKYGASSTFYTSTSESSRCCHHVSNASQIFYPIGFDANRGDCSVSSSDYRTDTTSYLLRSRVDQTQYHDGSVRKEGITMIGDDGDIEEFTDTEADDR